MTTQPVVVSTVTVLGFHWQHKKTTKQRT